MLNAGSPHILSSSSYAFYSVHLFLCLALHTLNQLYILKMLYINKLDIVKHKIPPCHVLKLIKSFWFMSDQRPVDWVESDINLLQKYSRKKYHFSTHWLIIQCAASVPTWSWTVSITITELFGEGRRVMWNVSPGSDRFKSSSIIWVARCHYSR